MRHANGRLTFAVTAILAMTALAQGATNSYLVTVDTSTVNGQTGTIDLQFNAGALTSENACVTISNFLSDGTLGTPPTTAGSVTGTLDTTLTINNGASGCSTRATYTASTVNDYNQPITFGNTLSFFVVLNGPGVTAPDPTTYTSGSSFGVAFTEGGNPALTSDPSNFAGNITLNLDGTNTPNPLAGPSQGASLVTIQPAELVTVSTSVSGLSFTVDGTAYTASQTFAWAIGSPHTLVTTSPQGSNGTRNSFTGWSDGTTNATDNITVATGTTSYTANFSTSYLLTAAASPAADGSVMVNTPSPTGDGYYPASTVVSLTANPASTGFKFVNWTGNVANANNASTTVTMTAPESVTANFALNNVNVTIGTAPSGLLVSVDGGTAQAAPVQVTWQVGSNHTITTTSPQGTGTRYAFTGWSDSGAISHQVTASASVTSYTASFSTSYLLTVAASPSADGSVGVTSMSTPVGGYYPSGAQVTLTATPASVTYKFVNWTGTTNTPTNPLTVTMNGPISETANFTLNQINVTVGTSPSNKGLSFSVDGTTYTGSKMLTWTIGDPHTIATTSPQLGSDGVYTFSKWSDNGGMSHMVTASATTTAYTATFTNADLTSSQVSTTLRAIGYNKNTQVATYNYTITNISKQTIAAPIQIVLLTPNLPGVNKSGTIGGHPYWTINTTLAPKNTVGLIIEVKSTKPNPTLTLVAYAGQILTNTATIAAMHPIGPARPLTLARAIMKPRN